MRHEIRFCHSKPLREPDTKVKSQLPKPVVRWQNIKRSNIDIFHKLDRPKVHSNDIVNQLYWLEESCALLSVDCTERGEEESNEEAAVLKRQKRGGEDRQLTLKDIVRKLKTLLGEACKRHQYKTDWLQSLFNAQNKTSISSNTWFPNGSLIVFCWIVLLVALKVLQFSVSTAYEQFYVCRNKMLIAP